MLFSLKNEWTECPPAVDLSSHFYFQTTSHLAPRKGGSEFLRSCYTLESLKKVSSLWLCANIGSLLENKDLHLLLSPKKRICFDANSAGHQGVKYNRKNCLKNLIWAPALLDCNSHKTQSHRKAGFRAVLLAGLVFKSDSFPDFC